MFLPIFKRSIVRRLIAGLVIVSAIPAIANSARRPNIILMMADDLGWGDLQSFRPESPIRTPNLDAMAANGLKFNRFYSAGSVCSPTRGSCLTGRHPSRYGILTANSGHLRSNEICLAEILRESGYATGHFGKWHLGTLSKTVKDSNRGGPRGAAHFSPPSENGFATFFSTEAKVPTYDPMLKPSRKPSSQFWPFIADRSKAFQYGTRYWNTDGSIETENLVGDDSKVIMDRAVPFIERAVNEDAPFFAVIWFHSPHLPVVAGPKYWDMYRNYKPYEASYFGCVSAMDEQIGRLRKRLRELGVAADTMLWFCSDNGPEGSAGSAPGSAGPFRGRKRSLHEGGVRVCGLLEWPNKIKTARSTDFPAVTSDYLPTILDVLDQPLPSDRELDGTSLANVIDGNDEPRQKPIFFHFKRQQAVSDNQFKLYSKDDGKSWQLYDLKNDPSESHDIASTHVEIVNNLKAKFVAWRTSCLTDAKK